MTLTRRQTCLYQEHPEFTARYEAIAPGLTEYLAEAMRVFAERR